MDKLKKFIEDKLELNNLSLAEKHAIVTDKIEELEKAAEELKKYGESLREELREELFKPIREIENQIKAEYRNLKVEIPHYEDFQYEVVIPFKIQKVQFACLLSFGDLQYEYGVYKYPILEGEKNSNTTDFLKPLFKKELIKEDEEWYGKKQTTEQNAFEDFKNLIEAVAKLDNMKWM